MWVWLLTLDELISGLNTLDTKLKPEVAKRGAPVIKGLLDKQISAGTDPKGIPWVLNKDGTRPLDGVQKYVDVVARGESIAVKLDEPASYHQTGTVHLPKRQIAPTDDLPPTWEAAIQAVVNEVIADGTLDVR